MRSHAKAVVRHRILIVDDEESTRLVLARLLAHDLKAEMTLAGTCEQALKLAGTYVYDVIVLDLMMPGIGGFEVLKEIRAESPNAHTPVVVVSVLADQQTMDKTLAAGANAYVVKPVDRESLVATVRGQLGARRRAGHPAD